ncbi:MAG: PorT family protein [Chitinophagales bacterium]|nr:PorT family protein [Chitinophagales bacterium]
MKKIYLVSLIMCSSFFAFSQTGLHAGVNIGLNSTWILNQNNYGYSEMGYELKFGAYPGLAFGYNITPMHGVQIEMNYAMLGQNYFDRMRDFSLGDTIGKPVKVDTYRYVKLNYLHIPVLYRFQTEKAKKDKIEFHIMAGPVIGLLLSADQYYESDIADNGTLVKLEYEYAPESLIHDFDSTPEVEEPLEYFTKLDIGLQLDAGVDIYITDNIYVTPAIKVYYGFADVNTEPTRNILNYTASHNSFAGIHIGIHYLVVQKK